jgi:hypothetical protein
MNFDHRLSSENTPHDLDIIILCSLGLTEGEIPEGFFPRFFAVDSLNSLACIYSCRPIYSESMACWTSDEDMLMVNLMDLPGQFQWDYNIIPGPTSLRRILLPAEVH